MALLHDVLLNDLQDSVLLESLSGDVEGEIVGVDNTLNEREPLGDEVLAVVHDEHSSDVELEVVLLLFVLEQIEGSSLGHEQKRGELELTLDTEVLAGKVLLPVVGQRLVERYVLVLGHILWLSHPDGLGLVESLVLVGHLLDLLGFLLLGLVLLLDLGVVLVLLLIFFLFVLLLVLFIGVGDLLVGGLLNHELDGEADELRVLLDEVLQFSLLKELLLVLLERQNDLGTSGDAFVAGWVDGESTTGVGLPLVLLVVIVLGDNSNLLGDKIGGVETHTELTNHGNIGSGGDGLHETSSSGLGNGTEVVDEVTLSHTNT